MTRHVLLYGLAGGALIALLELIEYRYLVVVRSAEIYGGLIAAVFAALGIWLGVRLTRPPTVIVREVQVPAPGPVPIDAPAASPPDPAPAPFVRDSIRVAALGVTPRELEILELIAAGLSNREIAERIFVSENTVKTHSSRIFGKLGARRRTQAVQLGKAQRLIP